MRRASRCFADGSGKYLQLFSCLQIQKMGEILKTKKSLAGTFLFLLIAFSGSAAKAQMSPQAILGGVINQLQTGTPNPGWYSPYMWGLIAAQTGNSGIYPQLASLGPVQNISLVKTQALPNGTLYALSATHGAGKSEWLLGIGTFTNRIEYAEFKVGSPVSIPNPIPPKPTPDNPTPKPADSDACKQFPNLC